MTVRSRRTARRWHLLTCAIAASAVVLQFVLVLEGHQHLGETSPALQAAGQPPLGTRLVRFASYLTIWSNVIAAATAATLAVNPARDGRVWRGFRLAGVAILFGGGLVHYFFLRPLLDLRGADLVADKLLHIAVPLLVVVGWLLYGPRNRVDRAAVGGFLAVLLGWLVYTLVRGAIVDWYPYPFVDVMTRGYARVLLTCLAVALLMVGLGLGARLLDRRLPAGEYDSAG